MKTSKLLIATVLNFVITVVELAGGLLAGSLALVADALHNFADGTALLISYAAWAISKKGKTVRKTYGYRRAQILAAVINSGFLVGISVFLIKEAVRRLAHPTLVKENIVIGVAAVGLAANLLAIIFLKSESRKGLNFRAAFLHLLSDAVSTAAVVAGGILMALYRIYWVDPLLTLLINVYILGECVRIINQAVHIIMQGAPPHLDVDEIVQRIRTIKEIEDVHHVHVWSLDEERIYFEAHVNVQDMPVSRTNGIYERIEKELLDSFGIGHVTIQFEYRCCEGEGVIPAG